MDSERKYVVIKDVKRINVRYYLIQIDNKSYIIDFANPKDFKIYFFWIFIASNNQWKIYDVSGKEKEYITKSPALFQNLFSTILLFLVMICYIINVDSAPAHINLRQLTMDSRIVQYWPLSIAFVFTIPFIIGIILYRKETDLILVEKSEILVLDDRRSKKMIIYMWCVLPLLFISGLNILRWWDIVSYNVL
jgi:hypothetical protein